MKKFTYILAIITLTVFGFALSGCKKTTVTPTAAPSSQSTTVPTQSVTEAPTEAPTTTLAQPDKNSVSSVLEKAEGLDVGEFTDDAYEVRGIVKVLSYDTKNLSYTATISDLVDSTKTIIVYGGKLSTGIITPVVGDIVVAYGCITNYYGVIELSGRAANKESGLEAIDYPIYTSVTHNTYTITVKSGIENGTVSVNKDSAKSGETITITLTPAAGYKVGRVLLGSKTLMPAAGVYSFVCAGDAEVNVEFVPSSQSTETETYFGFESGEDFTHTEVYNNVDEAVFGKSGKQWGTIFGAPSKTGTISGLQSMQMRWYTNKVTLGRVYTKFTTKNLTKVDFVAASTEGLKVKVSVSTDGTNWTNEETYDLTGVKESYTYEKELPAGNYYVKFDLVLGSPVPSKTSRVYIDDVSLFYIED